MHTSAMMTAEILASFGNGRKLCSDGKETALKA